MHRQHPTALRQEALDEREQAPALERLVERELARNPCGLPLIVSQFVQCMNYGPTTRIGDPQVAKQCASVVGRGASILFRWGHSLTIERRLGRRSSRLRRWTRGRAPASPIRPSSAGFGFQEELHGHDQWKAGALPPFLASQPSLTDRDTRSAYTTAHGRIAMVDTKWETLPIRCGRRGRSSTTLELLCTFEQSCWNTCSHLVHPASLRNNERS